MKDNDMTNQTTAVTLTKLEAQEAQHKLGVLDDSDDLRADYGLTEAQSKELYASVPSNGGQWLIPQFGVAAVREELRDHAKVLRDQANDMRDEKQIGHALASSRLALRLEAIADSVS